MKTNHTPGPWNIGEDNDVFADNCLCVAQVVGAPELEPEAIANARLIAAAPELLDALKDLITMRACNLISKKRDYNTDPWIKKARTAIAKAEGEKNARTAIAKAEGEKNAMKTRPPSGTKVRLTGEFLRNTGQVAGGEGFSRWLTVDCDCGLCKTGRFAAVNEKSQFADEPDRWRHINIGNLEKAR